MMKQLYPKNSKELKERIKDKGLREVHEGIIFQKGLIGLIKEEFKNLIGGSNSGRKSD